MAISRVEFNGQTLNAQNFTHIKHNEDTKDLIDQSNVTNQTQVQAEEKHNQVNNTEETDNREKKQDASEKGKNEYAGDGGKNRKRKEEDGRVMIKGQAPHGFDFKI